MTLIEQVEAYAEDIEMFESVNEKVDYILELSSANKTVVLQEEQIDKNKVNGCSSEAWLLNELKDGKIQFRALGMSSMAKGMLGMLLSVYNNRTPKEILDFDAKEFYKLGFNDILSPTRQQSLEAFLGKVYNVARGYL